MLWILAIVLLDLWYLSIETSSTFGGRTHVLPPLALLVVVVRIIQGRRAAPTAQEQEYEPSGVLKLDRSPSTETMSNRSEADE